MNRKTSLKIVRDTDGSVLVEVKFSDADLSKKDKSEVLRDLIKDASSDMFDLTNWKGVMKADYSHVLTKKFPGGNYE
jgi:hypothetical protein